MLPEEALEIIKKFHNSITDLRPDAIVQSYKELPYDYAKIKDAHFVCGATLVDSGKMTLELSLELLESYGIIESFFPEKPEITNSEYRMYLEGLRKGIITDFSMPNPYGECKSLIRLLRFLKEYWFDTYHTKLFTDDPLQAFIYDGYRNKATKEKDIELLIKLVNTTKTRRVLFPGKKDNKESIFITV